STHEAKSTPGPRIIALPLRQSSDYSITEPDAVGGQALSRRKTPPTAGSVRDGSGVPRPSGGDGGRTRVPTADQGSWPGRHHLGGGIRRGPRRDGACPTDHGRWSVHRAASRGGLRSAPRR